jgi:hypothetical protein
MPIDGEERCEAWFVDAPVHSHPSRVLRHQCRQFRLNPLALPRIDRVGRECREIQLRTDTHTQQRSRGEKPKRAL